MAKSTIAKLVSAIAKVCNAYFEYIHKIPNSCRSGNPHGFEKRRSRGGSSGSFDNTYTPKFII
jgi:hypothetical protein